MQHSHVIIAGAPKSGSTSLFSYLADHPDVCPCGKKEPDFFTDLSLLIGPEVIFNDKQSNETNYSNYCSLFPCHHAQRVLLDGSVRYMISEGTPGRIKSTLPNAKIIFLLRDPIERFISSYEHSQQLGIINPNISLEKFLEQQSRETVYVPIERRQLISGLYSKHLQRYYTIFDRKDILVLAFEDIKTNPRQILKDVCEFIGIQYDFYDNYEFAIKNPTIRHKRLKAYQMYFRIQDLTRSRFANIPIIFRMLKKINQLFIRPFYNRVNMSTKSKRSEVPSSIRNALAEFYRDEKELVYQLTGRRNILA